MLLWIAFPPIFGHIWLGTQMSFWKPSCPDCEIDFLSASILAYVESLLGMKQLCKNYGRTQSQLNLFPPFPLTHQLLDL